MIDAGGKIDDDTGGSTGLLTSGGVGGITGKALSAFATVTGTAGACEIGEVELMVGVPIGAAMPGVMGRICGAGGIIAAPPLTTGEREGVVVIDVAGGPAVLV